MFSRYAREKKAASNHRHRRKRGRGVLFHLEPEQERTLFLSSLLLSPSYTSDSRNQVPDRDPPCKLVKSRHTRLVNKSQGEISPTLNQVSTPQRPSSHVKTCPAIFESRNPQSKKSRTLKTPRPPAEHQNKERLRDMGRESRIKGSAHHVAATD